MARRSARRRNRGLQRRNAAIKCAKLSAPRRECYSADMADPVIIPPETALSAPLDHSRRQLETLLEVSEVIAQQRDLRVLFHELSDRLHAVVDFDFLTLTLHEADRNVMRLHVLETR